MRLRVGSWKKDEGEGEGDDDDGEMRMGMGEVAAMMPVCGCRTGQCIRRRVEARREAGLGSRGQRETSAEAWEDGRRRYLSASDGYLAGHECACGPISSLVDSIADGGGGGDV